jgi:predicted ATPase
MYLIAGKGWQMNEKHYLIEMSLRRDSVASFDKYPFCLPAVKHLRKIKFHPAVTFIIGENGSGKSTLLEAIAVASGFNPEGGSKNFHFGSRPSHSQLHEHLTLVRGVARPRDGFFLRAESFFNVATEIERMDDDPDIPADFPEPPIIARYGGKSLHEQSHGEAFLTLFLKRFGGHGLYILDEPEAALSPSRQMSLLARLHQLVQQQSQFLIATHSPIIMAYPNARILQLTEEGLKPVSYTQTEYYTLTKAFLNRHEQMLEELMKEPDPSV